MTNAKKESVDEEFTAAEIERFERVGARLKVERIQRERAAAGLVSAPALFRCTKDVPYPDHLCTKKDVRVPAELQCEPHPVLPRSVLGSAPLAAGEHFRRYPGDRPLSSGFPAVEVDDDGTIASVEDVVCLLGPFRTAIQGAESRVADDDRSLTNLRGQIEVLEKEIGRVEAAKFQHAEELTAAESRLQALLRDKTPEWAAAALKGRTPVAASPKEPPSYAVNTGEGIEVRRL